MNMNHTIEHPVRVTESQIGAVAYKLWESAGHPAGRDLEFWLNAEKQLRAAPKAASSTRVAPPAPAVADQKVVHQAVSAPLGPIPPNPAKAPQKSRRF
jgi:hypothetical protein